MHIPWDLIVTVICAVLGSQAFWQWLDRKNGRYRKMENMISDIGKRIDKLSIKEEADVADRWRSSILRFDAELRRNELHTSEEFAEIIKIVDRYLAYCNTHPDYPNTAAEVAINNIKTTYSGCKSERKYL